MSIDVLTPDIPVDHDGRPEDYPEDCIPNLSDLLAASFANVSQ